KCEALRKQNLAGCLKSESGHTLSGHSGARRRREPGMTMESQQETLHSGRRQHVEATVPAQSQIVGRALARIDGVDARRRRTHAARRDHIVDGLRRAGEYRLDRAVTAIAHPALQPAVMRLVLDESAEADALHAPADDDMANGGVGHAATPAGTKRCKDRSAAADKPQSRAAAMTSRM